MKLRGSARIAVAPLGALLAAMAGPGCAHSKPAEAVAAGPSEPVEDPIHGLQFELPAVEGGWTTTDEGTRLAKDVRVEVGSFPLAKPGTVTDCRDTARARLHALQRAAEEQDAREQKTASARDADAGAGQESGQSLGHNTSAGERETHAAEAMELPRDQSTSDEPSPSWSFTRGAERMAVRSRWAFFVRGADCLLIEVTGPLGSPAAEAVFRHAERTAHTVPLPAERQREIDVLAGMGFLQQRDPASAFERFDALARREPSFALAHYGALMSAFELGRAAYPRGLPHGAQALASEHDLTPDQRQLALSAMGVMELTLDQVKEAAQTLAELVVRAPELAEGQYNYACALARLGDAASAVDHLRGAFALDATLAVHAREDTDLISLHGRPEFEALLKSQGK